MTQKPLYTVFYRLIQKYDVPIGLEESILDRKHRHYEFEPNIALERFRKEAQSDKEVLPPVSEFKENLITVNFKDAKLKDVMDSIVKQMKNYDWEIRDDVINIFPNQGRDPRLQKLLKVKIPIFYVGMGANVGTIQAQLMLFLPEFNTFLKENNLEGNTSGNFSSFENRILPDGMVFKNMTFKELLNAITKSKRGGWMLKIKRLNSEPEKEFVEILI